jgi:hypothetical protein
MKKYIFTFIIVSIITSNNINLLAVSVRNYTIAPLNRVSIYFDQMPTIVEGLLTQDKRKLNINFGEVDFTSAQQFIVGEGIINKVELIKKDKNTFLILSLTDPRGFTIAKLPFSTGLIIEVFDWNKLDTAEEAYRMGLLSLIDNETELAIPDLLKGANGDIADASFFLGNTYLNKGKINTALKLFRFADLKGTSINDNYTALSQIYTYKKQNIDAERYAKIYKAKTGNPITPKIQFSPIIENGEQADTLPYIDSILNLEQKLVDTMPDTPKIDVKDTLTKDESIWETEGYLLTKYVIGIVIALILLVIYLYLKWRNKQLRAIEKQKLNQSKFQPVSKSTTDFDKIMEEKMKEQKSTIPSIPKSVPSGTPILTKEIARKKYPPKSKPKIQTDSVEYNSDYYKKNADNLISAFNTMKLVKSEDVVKSDSILKAELETSNYNAGESIYTSVKTNIQGNKHNSANINLASRLLSEQKKIQQEKLSLLSKTGGITSDKINEVAQKLGMDKGSLETKHNMDNLLQNEEKFKKLSEKFGVKKK